jgi:hypothetical protein
MARPMPREEPVTTATLPVKSNNDTIGSPRAYYLFCATAYSDPGKPAS